MNFDKASLYGHGCRVGDNNLIERVFEARRMRNMIERTLRKTWIKQMAVIGIEKHGRNERFDYRPEGMEEMINKMRYTITVFSNGH